MTGSRKLPDGWTRITVGDHAEIIFSNVDKKTTAGEKPVRLCNYTDVYYRDYIDSAEGLMEASATEAEVQKFALRRGDVLVTKDSEESDDIGVPALVTKGFENVLCGYHLAIIRPTGNGLDSGFLHQVFRCHYVRKQLFTEANGVTRFSLGIDAVQGLELLAPLVSEQKRIAALLGAWDRALAGLEKLLAAKRQRKQALMQQLLTGKKRFKSHTGERWKTYRLSDVFERVFRPVTLSDDSPLDLISIRRRSGGLFYRGSFSAREFKTLNLNSIEMGDFLVSKRQVTHGALAMVREQFSGMHVSNEYVIFRCKAPDKLHMPFFDWLSRTRRMWHLAYLASNGVHIEKLIFEADYFLREKISIPPSVSEQGKIVEVLEACDKEIALLSREADLLRDQKRGLMQQLLTGKVRVKG